MTSTTPSQLLRFSLVGASGFAINFAVFAAALSFGVHHVLAAAGAFVVAMAGNFACNRAWTFGAGDAAAAPQAARFAAVSIAACLFALVVVELLVGTAGVPELAAQPASIAAALPLSFAGNRAWAFADREPATEPRAPRQASRPSTWVVVPTYNEAENIEGFVRSVLPQLAAAAGEHRILVVDDSSPDGTGDIADRLAAELEQVEVLHRLEKDGLGRAYAAGFARALAGGAELVIQMDADLSHDPEHIPALIAAAADADLVLGSRYVAGGGVENWGVCRRVLSRGGSWYARTVLGVPVRDLTGGFKCFRRELLERLAAGGYETAGFGFQVELTYRSLRSGAVVREVPIRFRDRQAGASKMSSRIVFEALWRVIGLRLRGARFDAPAQVRPATRPRLQRSIQQSLGGGAQRLA
jgi:dolichol-phosphate mannosyltransferase